jgi:hypothetical protein
MPDRTSTQARDLARATATKQLMAPVPLLSRVVAALYLAAWLAAARFRLLADRALVRAGAAA